MAQKENRLILYRDEEGSISLSVRFTDEDVWLTQAQLVEIYQSSKSNISEHLTNIFADRELEEDAVVRKFRTTAADGKNYQTELELQRLNLLTSQFLDFAEFQALEQNPMTMADWVAALDEQILRLRKHILEGTGAVSHQDAMEKAEREFEIYREREMRLLESDFDRAIKELSLDMSR